jgi:hypothetical protein
VKYESSWRGVSASVQNYRDPVRIYPVLVTKLDRIQKKPTQGKQPWVHRIPSLTPVLIYLKIPYTYAPYT